ncbi:MAG: HAMP domain-containing histidine kinase [Anaerolineae bacterium]|nr:HAMP domain-containing histidine kinase [Anaerolineae bacterium]
MLHSQRRPPVFPAGIFFAAILERLTAAWRRRARQRRRGESQAAQIARLERQIAERTRDLESVRRQMMQGDRLSAAMNRAADYAEVLKAVADEVAAPAVGVWLLLVEVEPHAAQGAVLAAMRPPLGSVMPANRQMPAFVFPLPGEPLRVIVDVERQPDTPLRAFCRDAGLKAVASAGLFAGSRTLGALVFTGDTPQDFSAADLETLRAGAQAAAIAIERLQAVETVRSRFLAGVSHDLRTPLNAVLNYTEFVAQGMMGEVNDSQRAALEKALEGGRQLLDMMNDVVDAVRIESGMLRLVIEDDIDLYAEMADLRGAALALLHGKDAQYFEDIDPHLPRIVGDRWRIRQILRTLIANAIRVTESGSVTVSVKLRAAELLFAVIDTGPGIPVEDQDRLFEPSVPTNPLEARVGRGVGQGIGLPIAHRLVQAHGGRLWLHSEPHSEPEHGAAFFFTLPVRSPALLRQMQETPVRQAF